MQSSYPVQYQVVQKPLADRIVDAACIYFEVDSKDKWHGAYHRGNPLTQQRQILIYLLYTEASLTIAEVADKLSLGKSSVHQTIEIVDFNKGKYRTIAEHIKQILAISSTLDYKLVSINITMQ